MNLAQQIAIADMISYEHLLPDFAEGDKKRVSIETLSPDEVDALPFGAIQLDHEGRILQYNNYESRLAGIEKSSAIGRNFFTEIAPCTDVQAFRGQFTEGVARKQLHVKFQYYFSFRDTPRDVTVSLYYSDVTDSTWVFIRPV